MRKKIENLEDLLLEQANDLYSAKQLQLKALPQLKEYVTSKILRKNIENQIKQTEAQIIRFEEFFNQPVHPHENLEGQCMKSLIQEGNELVELCENEKVRDAAIITAIQHMNHYNIAGFGTAYSYAKELNHSRDARILKDLLENEKDFDELLTELAVKKINSGAIALA